MNSQKEFINKLLENTSVALNGPNPWDPQILNERVYDRVINEGNLGLGESYMDGWWSSAKLDEMIYRAFMSEIKSKLKVNLESLLVFAKAAMFNLQSAQRAFHVGEHHYDKGNDLFKKMLDKRMIYSCGYWENANNLDEAQEAKLELCCKKLGLKKGMKVLDIGCGWGGFAKYAAEKYGVDVVGITISRQQAELAKEVCKGLKVDIRLQDYREIDEKFDAVISIGMFEHVGARNYRVYMKAVHRCLDNQGISLLHTIGANKSARNFDPWINKYIFPNGMIPSFDLSARAADRLLVIEDVHNIGQYYDNTLMAWNENFQRAWPELKGMYDDRFKRMWEFYLLICAGLFRSRHLQVWQIVFTKIGRPHPNCRFN